MGFDHGGEELFLAISTNFRRTGNTQFFKQGYSPWGNGDMRLCLKYNTWATKCQLKCLNLGLLFQCNGIIFIS